MESKLVEYGDFSRRINILPLDTRRALAGQYHCFSSAVPWHTYDTGFHDPLPVLEVKVRCQRKHHKIILWPNGCLTLAAHTGKRGQQAAKVAEAMGQRVRCLEVLDDWVTALKGMQYSRKALPKALQPVADRCRELRKVRQNKRRKVEKILPMSSIARQERSRRLMCLRLRTEMIEQAGDMCPEMFREFGEHSQWKMKVQVSQNIQAWSKNLTPSGLLRRPIEFHGASFIPMMVPPSTVEASYGPGIVRSNTGKKCWARLEKRGREWVILYIEGPLA